MSEFDFFSIPREWDGETCVIVGGGPSLDLHQVHLLARAKLLGKTRVLAVNDAVFACWWADWLHGCDRKWWDWHIQCVAKFPGRKTTLDRTLPPQWGVKSLNNTGKTGFDENPSCCRTGSNGVYQAMHCLLHAGVKRIGLVGVDMKMDGKKTHWFGMHPNKVTVAYASVMAPHFETLKPAIEARRIKVRNCSPGSALEAFPMKKLSSFLGVE